MEGNYSFRQFFQYVYQKDGRSAACPHTGGKELEKWQHDFRKALWERLGLNRLSALADGAESPGVRLVSSCREEGYLRQKYVMQTLPFVEMPFYVLIPDGVDAKNPARAMLTFPAHGANKNTVCGIAETPEETEKIKAAPDECYGREFVRRGYVVFCPDPPGYGERVEPMPSEDKSFVPDRERSSLDSSCKDLAQTAEALGLSLTGLTVWELRRLLDYACGRPEVKKDALGHPRIGCAGFSGGGADSMWLAALDERIRLAVISGYIHGYYDSLLECHLCPCNYAPSLWLLGDICDICSLIAPRPLFAENGTTDVENGPYGIAGPSSQMEKIRQAYTLLGAPEALEHRTPEGIHRWYGECYSFVDQML